MSEQFTARAAWAMTVAQEEARNFKQTRVGTEQLLLGLLTPQNNLVGGVISDFLNRTFGVRRSRALEVLQSFGLKLKYVRMSVRKYVCLAEDPLLPRNEIPFSERATRSLALARRHADELGQTFIGTEHLLLGMLSVPGCRAIEVLEVHQVQPDDVRAAVYARLGVDQP